jgi:hypothetical protein
MSEYTSDAIRPVGELRDALGRALAIGSDCDAVVIRVPRSRVLSDVIHLDKTQRAEFERLFFEAERQAEQWAKEHGGGS